MVVWLLVILKGCTLSTPTKKIKTVLYKYGHREKLKPILVGSLPSMRPTRNLLRRYTSQYQTNLSLSPMGYFPLLKKMEKGSVLTIG